MNVLETVFRALLDSSWRASWLIVLVLAVRHWVGGRVAARLLFWVWIAVAIRLLVPMSLPVAWSPFNLASWSGAPIRELKLFAPLAATPAVAAANTPATATVASHVTVSSTAALSVGEWAALIWAVGVVVLLSVRIRAGMRFARKLRRSAAAPGPTEAALLAAASRALDLRGMTVLVTDAVAAPALYGIFRPRVLFPRGFLENLSPSEIQLTLAHELAHVRRRDLLADAILHLAVVVHWFNPLAWLAARMARQDCELACDETVLRRVAGDERESYGATLLRVARMTTESRGPGFTLGVVSAKGQIKRRIQMIVANRSFPLLGTLMSGAVAVAVTGLSFTSEVAAQTPIRNRLPPTSAASVAAAQPSAFGVVYNPSVDRLDVLFPTGVVATVADRNIMVADVRQHIAPLIPQMQQAARTQEEFNGKLSLLQNSAVKELVARALLIRQFHDQKDGEQARLIEAKYVDNAIADEIAERFGGDRSKYLQYLKERGLTQREYRKQREEDIIFNYMMARERKVAGVVERKKPEPAEEKTIRLRVIQLTRAEGATDAALLEKANAILARFKNGESFESLAREFDDSKKRDRGGDWGWMGAADIRPEYRDAFVALKKGDVSAPILAKEGCFLLYADDQRQ